jgi:two-component system, chemotaxis family, CheB/CheR fusion protein
LILSHQQKNYQPLISFLQHLAVIPQENEIEIKQKSQSHLEKIIFLLRTQTGHDFSLYKKNTLFRRIERRMSIHQIDKIYSYIRFLQENPKELDILFKELLIGVTSFFRDTAVWTKLKEKILPDLFDELPNGYILRAWIPACSTGEEAYSLAIVFKETLDKLQLTKTFALQIFATDLDSDAIEIARKGIFSPNLVAEVSPDRIKQFFTPESHGYIVNTNIREMVIFATQNIIKDPPFTKLDILSCRNLLIYMEPELQKKLIVLFHYSLNPGGVMLLGSAESDNSQSAMFTLLDARLKFYKRSVTPITTELVNFPSSFSQKKVQATEVAKMMKVNDNIQELTEQVLLQQFTPSSVLINEQGDILYITGSTGKYLEPATGKANMNIYAMARKGLANELPNAIRKAKKSYEPVILRNLKITANGLTSTVDITVQNIEKPDAIKGTIIVVFTDIVTVPELVTLKTEKTESNLLQHEIELELKHTKEELQSLNEEMQTSQEELKSSNEELQSSNEELQSTNEELTTSKEEMQSLNEEMQTVNVELQNKITDLVQANNDMKNLLNSTDIATLFLDKGLNIRRFTDQITKLFKIRSSDIGRPFTDIVSDLKYPEISNHSIEVLRTLVYKETNISTKDNRWFCVRIMPYRTLDDHIDGLVITFIDITTAKQTEVALSISETHYRCLFESAKEGILILDAKTGKITDVNPFLINLLGYSQDQFIEKAIWEIGFLKDIVANKDKFIELQQKEFVRYENLPLETADGQKIQVEFISNLYSVNSIKVIQCFIRERSVG